MSASIAFGPIPSRRLGRSLGINNIPPKVCSYSCVYCQVGRTSRMQVERQAFYSLDEILTAVQTQVEAARAAEEGIDYLSFVPDGEPTLDLYLGREIATLRPLGIPVAVISNGSLLWREDVRAGLMEADWVSIKVDAVWEDTWHKVDRPRRSLDLPSILKGAANFAANYRGTLVTETMLVRGLNDDEAHLRALAGHLARLEPDVAYLSIPIRPPAEDWVCAPNETAINRAYQILRDEVKCVETLIGYEGNAFAHTGNVEDDLLSITAVHPMREDAVSALLARAQADWTTVQAMIAAGQLVEIAYGGRRFYVRKTNSAKGHRE